MVLEVFRPQLTRDGAPSCVLCGGKTMNGLNCTCATEAMWLYRASQGKLDISACLVRDLTNDCVGGTNLRQMEAVSTHYGITTGKVYQPVDFAFVADRVSTGRYGSHLNILYAPFVNTPYDRFFGRFTGNHDIYLSNRGSTPGTLRVGDPGAKAYHDIPISLLRTAAGRLDLGGGETINSNNGVGKCYAYLTPADPAVPTTLYHFRVTGPNKVYHAPETAAYRNLNSGSGSCRKTKVNNHLWFQVVKPGSPINNQWLHAGPALEVTPI